jgi:NarL family two-component system response regulator LiaR
MDQPNERTKLRVLIVDDHPMMRGALRLTIDNEMDMQVVGEAIDGFQAVRTAEVCHPDVVVMDLYLPGGMDGAAATREILRVQPRVRVLIITSSTDDEHVLSAIVAGALGYVQKDATSEQFVHSVRQVAQGNLFLKPEIAKKLTHGVRQVVREAQRDAATAAPEPGVSEGQRTVGLSQIPGEGESQVELGLDLLTRREMEVLTWIGKG